MLWWEEGGCGGGKVGMVGGRWVWWEEGGLVRQTWIMCSRGRWWWFVATLSCEDIWCGGRGGDGERGKGEGKGREKGVRKREEGEEGGGG